LFKSQDSNSTTRNQAAGVLITSTTQSIFPAHDFSIQAAWRSDPEHIDDPKTLELVASSDPKLSCMHGP
jgi:hypothetical protein